MFYSSSVVWGYVDDVAGYKVPVPTSSTLALFNSYEHRSRIHFVADQAADRRGFHQSDVKTTILTSTGSQSSTGFLRDVIQTLSISAFLTLRTN